MSRPEGLKSVGKNVCAIPAVWDRWDRAAEGAGKARQQWIRDTLNEAAGKVEARLAKKAGQG
jgi:hypothetical protein